MTCEGKCVHTSQGQDLPLFLCAAGVSGEWFSSPSRCLTIEGTIRGRNPSKVVGAADRVNGAYTAVGGRG